MRRLFLVLLFFTGTCEVQAQYVRQPSGMQFETEKKDRDLTFLEQQIELLTQQRLLQASELQKNRLVRNFLITGSCMMFVILALLYSRYRFKEKVKGVLQFKQTKINLSNQRLTHLNEELHKLLGEKEWLVKEIHHRVKNNLQMVVSLLNTQAATLKDINALLAIRESQSRMQVISLLHQKLYDVENEGIVDMKIYIPELVGFLKESYNGINHIYFDLKIDDILMDISRAVPIGLILNEAITNSIKYGFHDGQQGIIRIEFEKMQHELMLSVIDNGIGLQPDFEKKKGNTLGMKLMETLSDQLDGHMNIVNNEGVAVRIRFPLLLKGISNLTL